jgi:hypothetical protein
VNYSVRTENSQKEAEVPQLLNVPEGTNVVIFPKEVVISTIK